MADRPVDILLRRNKARIEGPMTSFLYRSPQQAQLAQDAAEYLGESVGAICRAAVDAAIERAYRAGMQRKGEK